MKSSSDLASQLGKVQSNRHRLFWDIRREHEKQSGLLIINDVERDKPLFIYTLRHLDHSLRFRGKSHQVQPRKLGGGSLPFPLP